MVILIMTRRCVAEHVTGIIFDGFDCEVIGLIPVHLLEQSQHFHLKTVTSGIVEWFMNLMVYELNISRRIDPPCS